MLNLCKLLVVDSRSDGYFDFEFNPKSYELYLNLNNIEFIRYLENDIYFTYFNENKVVHISLVSGKKILCGKSEFLSSIRDFKLNNLLND